MEHIKSLINLFTALWLESTRRQLAGPGSAGTVALEVFEDELIWPTRRLKDRNWQKLYQAIDLAG